ETDKLFFDEQITYLVHPQEFLPEDWNKVMFAGPADLLEQVEYFVSKRKYPGVYFVATAANYFEMLPQNVTKGTAMLKVCELLDVPPENTFAIGDYYNDIDMLRASGHAVAMENAPKEIKMLADTTTGSCNESGVGQFLFTLIQKYAT
ncbi:HAD hydrolase family protein, partial [Ruminococcaceae bacterium OttesenSCG-928-A16]|nr:HAD hydrolase family protein [Ruminococcaceae bacterium OttesenSCG-928-A16]